MLELNLPKITPKVILKAHKPYIFDIIRQKYVALTPEEWVRQHFVHYLLANKNYPKELINNEVLIKLNNMPRRCDTVIYDSFLEPKMIIEYKASHINITEKVFDQIARYNMVLNVEYLIVSNGLTHFCCKIDLLNQTYSFLKEIPSYSEIISAEV